MDSLGTGGKIGGELAALGAIAGTFLDWLPAVAAGVAILWHCLLIYDWVKKKNNEE